jgi:hypothetical protein
MGPAANVMIPLFLFMLIPVWIPLIAIVVGNVLDRVRPAPISPAAAVVADLKTRSAAARSTSRIPAPTTSTSAAARLAA